MMLTPRRICLIWSNGSTAVPAAGCAPNPPPTRAASASSRGNARRMLMRTILPYLAFIHHMVVETKRLNWILKKPENRLLTRAARKREDRYFQRAWQRKPKPVDTHLY